MHDTSFENLELLINNYKNFLSGKDIKVLDIGSRVRTPEKITRWKGIIPDYYEYIGIDIEKGQNVDIVLDSPYKYPFEDNSIDLIIANSIFEHSEFFWELFLELLRILKPSGLLYINAPSNGDFHRGPVDVYRFYPDSGKALEKWGIKNGYENTLLLESYTGKGGAVSYALKYISTDYVFVHDADLEYFPTDIVEMFALTNYNPDALILGSRTIGNKERKKIYFWTYLGNKLFALLFSLLNNYKVSDIASCYWLIETQKLKKMNISEKGFGIEVEVLSKYIRSGGKVLEIPISYTGRTYEDGKKIRIKDGLNILIKIIKFSKILN